MSIANLLIRESDTLASALRTIDRNGLGLAFAVDEEGRLAGRVDAAEIAACLGRGGSLSGPVRDAMVRNTDALPVDAAAEAIGRKINGHGAIVPLVDASRRPIGVASPARGRRIPVAEPSLSGKELEYVTECIRTNWISSQGTFVRRFEQDFAAKIGAPAALAVSNGTVALHLALVALGIGPGDEVIVRDLTFAATINTVIHAGATPVIVDVNRASWNMDPAAVEAAITPRTRALMPVHLYGQPADMDALLAIAARHGLKVIEDAAEAAGASYNGRHCGAIGDAGTFSFFSNKLITTGEGGMAVFRDPAVAERARRLRDHGMDPAKRYWHLEVGYNYRLTNLQAALGCAQLEQWDRFLARKLQIADGYRAGLAELPGMVLPAQLPGLANSYWAFSIVPDMERLGITREEFMVRLADAGIETRPLFYPLHAMPPYAQYGGGRSFAVSTALSAHGVSLPSAVTLGDAEIRYICGVIARLHDTRLLARRTGTA